MCFIIKFEFGPIHFQQCINTKIIMYQSTLTNVKTSAYIKFFKWLVGWKLKKTYAVLSISGCTLYSLAKTKGTIPWGSAAWQEIQIELTYTISISHVVDLTSYLRKYWLILMLIPLPYFLPTVSFIFKTLTRRQMHEINHNKVLLIKTKLVNVPVQLQCEEEPLEGQWQ